jgi:outer membrane receptor for ferric coprogen and ferric-rhodotorulic acid
LVQANSPASHAYAIPAGPLNQQLSQFAAQSGVYLAGDASLATGSGAALTGNYGVEEGFGILLAGSGLQAVRQPNGSYLLGAVPEVMRWWCWRLSIRMASLKAPAPTPRAI